MAGPLLFDRIKESATTTGTGTFSLSGAASGFQAFSSVLANGDTCYYTISNQAVAEWEVGIGTYSGATLARTTVLSNSAGTTALISFSAGTKDVFISAPAAILAGNATKTGTQAAKPSAGQPGLLYLPSDGPYLSRDNGSSFDVFGPLLPQLVAPISGNYAWVNQGTATLDTTRGTMLLTAQPTSAFNVRALVKAVPATPYVIDALVAVNGHPAFDWFAGVMWRSSSGAQIQCCGLAYDNGGFSRVTVESDTFNSVTSSAGGSQVGDNAYNYPGMLANYVWLRLKDDGTNRTFSVSPDGVCWIDFDVRGHTSFFTPDQVGIFADSDSNTTYPAYCHLLSWREH